MTQELSPSGLDLPRDIITHDRRVRVFVSSTLEELASERRAARAAITKLRLTPVMFELGARPHPPRELYRSYLAQSDVFIGIYGESYGWIAPGSEISGLEDEYRLSGDKPRLMYVKSPAPGREPRLTAMIEHIWASSGASTTPFADASELEDQIADDLAVLLTERFAAADAATTTLRPEPLPVPLTPLMGREAELMEVLGLLRRPEIRLVTITGSGGIGKTRLALEAAAQASDGIGVCFVDLAPITDDVLVPSVIAGALGMRHAGSRPALAVLMDRLADRRLLLLLDNFEQVPDAARQVVQLLTSSPGIRALVTSRRVLRVRGEREVTLSPLSTPQHVDDELDGLGGFAAVQILVSRAQQARPGFAVTPENARAVAEIVRRLEGIPLALELAGARLRLLTPQALLHRLDQRLDLSSYDVDAPSRQHTLRRTIAWSYDLLNDSERTLLGRLSAFVGGWSLAGAEAMCLGDSAPDVLETLSSLVEHNLVIADDRPYGEPRFRMLETVREYVLEQLRESGGYDDAMRRLAAHVAGVADSFGNSSDGSDRRHWSECLDAELDSIRAVLQWALEQDDAELVLSVTAPAYQYWWRHGLLREMLDVAERTAALPSAAGLPPRSSTLLLWTRGTIRIALGRTPEAVPMLQQAAEAAKSLDDDWIRAHSLFSLAMTLPQEDAATMQAMLEESVELFRGLGDRWSVALALTPLGDLAALIEGDVPRGTAIHEEALRVSEGIDDYYMRAQSLDQLALDAMLAGDVDGARSRLAAAADLHRRLGDQEGLAYCITGLAGVATASGRTELAARLIGAADRILQVQGLAIWPLMVPLFDQLRESVRTLLGDASYEQEHARGEAMEPLDALDLGLRDA